jgi:hypothetical protein
VSLAARHLEEHGIPTVVFGCARDIVEHCGVPRFVFSDFPLGSPTGRPLDPAMQREVVGMGLDLLERATGPVTVVNPHEWSPDHSWKEKIFSAEQPFLSEEATQRWLERKQAYRDLKTTGQP